MIKIIQRYNYEMVRVHLLAFLSKEAFYKYIEDCITFYKLFQKVTK